MLGYFEKVNYLLSIVYIEQMNRPYNVQMLHDNLHGSVGKTALQKIVQSLADEGKLTCKEFGKQKLYWFNQDGKDVADKDELVELGICHRLLCLLP